MALGECGAIAFCFVCKLTWICLGSHKVKTVETSLLKMWGANASCGLVRSAWWGAHWASLKCRQDMARHRICEARGIREIPCLYTEIVTLNFAAQEDSLPGKVPGAIHQEHYPRGKDLCKITPDSHFSGICFAVWWPARFEGYDLLEGWSIRPILSSSTSRRTWWLCARVPPPKYSPP